MSFEDCIDVVRDWVIEQAYATIAYVDAEIAASKAWVNKWFSPVIITGILTPDVTGSYFKGGCFESLPWYLRSDGKYTIWFTDSDEWQIGDDLDDPGVPLFVRREPSVFGDFQSTPRATGTATAAPDLCNVKPALVNRGDPAVPDKVLGQFVQDNTWRDWDLSAIVPAGAKGVAITIDMVPILASRIIEFRRNGNVNARNRMIAASQVAFVLHSIDGVCPIDSNRVIEYKIAAGGFATMNVTIKNWWF